MEKFYLSLFLNENPLIDVRAPVEYLKGAFDQSVNLPILNDEERVLVGTAYKKSGSQAALALGQHLVSGKTKDERIQAWVEFIKNNSAKGPTYLYCFRGGLRSKIATEWLQKSGHPLSRVPGGYKALRQYLRQSLKPTLDHLNFLILSGNTGVGKTDLLQNKSILKKTIDLEGLAQHRGSSFGKIKNLSQPTQINFENALIQKLLLLHHDPQEIFGKGPVIIENEGKNIGQRLVPLELYNKMQTSPIVVIERSFEERIDLILKTYVHEKFKYLSQYSLDPISDHHQEINDNIKRLSTRLGGLRVKELLGLTEVAFQEQRERPEQISFAGHRHWIEKLLVYYYDPLYQRNLIKNQKRIIFRGSLEEVKSFFHQLQMQV